jgi:hypothetical protein
MTDSGGMLQSFAIARELGLVPLPLLLAAFGTMLASLARPAAAAPRSLAAWCAGAAVLSWGLTLHAIVDLAALPPGQRSLFCHLAQGVRIGSLDVSLGLAFDSLAAPLLLAVSTIGALVLLLSAISHRRSPVSARALGASCLLLFAMQAMLLSSGFFLLLSAWSLAAVASAILLGRRALSAGAGLPELALLAAAALVFWLYGGGWHGDGYVPELRPRVVAVPMGAATDAASAPAKGGSLSLRALAGTRIGLSGAELCEVDAGGRIGGIGLSARPCREPARSPFVRLPTPNAIHDIRLFTGHGTDQLVVEKVRIEAGRETWLSLVGPTLDFGELADQLLIREPLGDKALSRTLPRAELFGWPAFPIAVLLVVLATALKHVRVHRAWAKALPESSPAAALLCGLCALAGVYALARLSFLVALTPAIAAFGAVVGCAIAVRAAARAVVAPGARTAPLFLAGAHGGIAFSGAAAGAAESSVLYLAIASTAACAYALAVGGEARARWLGKLAVSAAPLAALAAMLAEVSGAEGLSLPGQLVAALLLAGSGLISFAVWCTPGRAAKPERETGGFSALAARALAVVTLAGGLFAGYLERVDQAKGALAAAFVVTLCAWLMARRQPEPDEKGAVRSPLMAWLGGAQEESAPVRRIGDAIDWVAARVDRAERILYVPLGAEATKPESDR